VVLARVDSEVPSNRSKGARAFRATPFDLTILKLHCGKLTLKIYTKGERVLRIEVVVHNTEELQSGRSLEKFPQILAQTKDTLVRFIDALSCIDQCFIADSMLEELPTPSRIGKTKVGGIDLNMPRMRYVVQAVIALPLSTSRNSGARTSCGASGRHADINRRPADSRLFAKRHARVSKTSLQR
jgi:hypothetical protein